MRFTSETEASVEGREIDLAIGCLGYEARAVEVGTNFFQRAERKIALGFDRHHVHDYHKNLAIFREQGFEVFENVGDGAFEVTLNSILDESISLRQKKELKVCIDISCFDRFRLAVIVEILRGRLKDREINDVTYFYSVAAYAKPDSAFSTNARLQPVHPAFVGSRPDPLSRTVAIIGLGYEQEKAVGAAEYLEASEVFAFFPQSEVQEYYDSVKRANGLLLSQLDEAHRIIYKVEDCAALISDISSLVRGLMGKSAVILIPLGPKIFALACLLTASILRGTSVWRMSQGAGGAALNRFSSRSYSILRVRL